MILGYLALCWLLGMAAAAFTQGNPWAITTAALLAAIAPLIARRSAFALLWAAMAVAFLVGGAWLYQSSLPSAEAQGIATHNVEPGDESDAETDTEPDAESDAKTVTFRAVVSDEPDERGSSLRLRLSAREVLVRGSWQTTSGGILMRSGLFPRYDYGDLLELEGKLETPPVLEDFNYRDYLARQGISFIVNYPRTSLIATGQGNPIRAWIYDLRAELSSSLEDALPEPEAALAQGILLGRRASLPDDLKEDLNDTNTSHLIAVSGYNVTLVAGLFIAALAWLIGRRPAAWLALLAIIAYATLVGGQPSVQRAAIMGGMYVVATALGRQSGALQGLALAGAGMTAFDPLLMKDISFQLSFASALGLIVFSPALRARMESALVHWSADRELASPLRAVIELFAVTLAAIAFTLPIIAVNFHRISLIAIPANLLTVPAFPLIMVTSALTAVGGMIATPIGTLLGWIAWVPVAYMLEVVTLLADLPFAAVSVDGLTSAHALAYYAGLAGIVWLTVRRPPKLTLPQAPAWASDLLSGLTRPLAVLPAVGIAIVLALATVFVWLLILGSPGDRLSVTFLDVGQGDAILIHSPSGHNILVDGGPNGEEITAALGRHLPFWDRHLHLVVLTHPDQDHLAGLVTVLERYDVDQILAPALADDSATFDAWQEAIAERDIPQLEAFAGQWIDLGGGASLSVLHPPPELLPADEDDNSLVLKVSLGDAAFLLTADIGAEGEAYLLNNHADLRAPVLKVAHHGSRASTTTAFLAAVEPLTAVISVGEDNRYGQPAPETLDRLNGRPVFRTDRHGDVQISTDGHKLWIKTQVQWE
jgi:competence protein ComEC